jgi:GxxExxY protein
MDDPIAKIDLSKLLLGDETYQIVGAAMEVYYKLGTGFLEPVYQQALAIELKQRSILFEQEKRFQIDYKGTILEKEYVADFVCFDQVIVEIKALNQLSPVDWSQVLNYLKSQQNARWATVQFWQCW